jgi:Tfp pilus assembly protein PilF
MIVVDPAQLPDWLEPEQTLQQLSIMEKHGATASALTGYRQAVRLWPQDARFWLGQANSAVRLGDQAMAKQAFEQLLEHFPGYGPGLNNYADFLQKQGKPALALPFAQQAVEVMDTPTTRQTLKEIEEQLVY